MSGPFDGVLDVRTVPIERITRYTKNPRKKQAIEKVKASLAEFGWRQPIVVDRDYVIVVGDTRYLAAVDMGMPAVPIHIAADLTVAQIKAYRLADNRAAEDSEWDDDLLRGELQALEALGADITTTLFEPDEIDKLLTEADAPTLTPVDVKPLPTMTWVLIGIPTTRYIEIAEEVERISMVDDLFLELTANSDKASAHRKAAKLVHPTAPGASDV